MYTTFMNLYLVGTIPFKTFINSVAAEAIKQ